MSPNANWTPCISMHSSQPIRSKAVQRFEVFKVWPSYKKNLGTSRNKSHEDSFQSQFRGVGCPCVGRECLDWNQRLKWLAFMLHSSWNDWVSDTNRFILSISLLTWNSAKTLSVGLCEVRRWCEDGSWCWYLLMNGKLLARPSVHIPPRPGHLAKYMTNQTWERCAVQKAPASTRRIPRSLQVKKLDKVASQNPKNPSLVLAAVVVQVLAITFCFDHEKKEPQEKIHFASLLQENSRFQAFGLCLRLRHGDHGRTASLLCPGNRNRKNRRTSRK